MQLFSRLFWQFSLRLKYLFLGFIVLVQAFNAEAEYTIAVVGKTKNDSFYQQSYAGCKVFAEKYPDLNCLYDGPFDFQDARTQVLVVQELVATGIDGLLISTTDSGHLVKGALKQLTGKIPVITFDSDLLPEHQQYRMAYVGTNNVEFGIALGTYAKRLKTKETQAICIQSGHESTPNLNDRIAGVRYALSGQSQKRLNGEKGWIEHPRCPLFSMGKRDIALFQLQTMLQKPEPPIFLAVAGFAQFNPDYADSLAPFKKEIQGKDKVVISADTEALQLFVLREGLSTVNIGQNPYEMGRLGAELMYLYLTEGKKPDKSHYYLDFHYCTQDNYQTCTVNH